MNLAAAANTPKEKRRRVTRACDACRRKKTRCDGAQDLEQCTPCSELTLECTWQDEAKKRGRPQKELMELKDRVKQLEEVIRIMKSDGISSRTDISDVSLPWGEESARERGPLDNSSGSTDDDDIMEPLITRTRRLDLDALSFTGGVGHSNGFLFNKKVHKLRDENMMDHGHPTPQQQEQEEEEADFWQSHVRAQLLHWQTNTHFQFPDPDLIPVLINAYMVHMNDLWPLLHRPSFERQVYHRVHLSDPSFGSVLLLVCALGARFVEDPRVIPPGHTTKRAAGWQWFVQVDISRRDLFRAPRLLDVQTYILAAFYGGTIFRSQLSWVLVGIALRMIHQVGAHSKKVYSTVPNTDDELWKRCFWVVYACDIVMASETGRPSLMCESDFDLDLPIECDDEYWEVQDPALAFQQPAGTPSKLAFFIRMIKLRQIHLKAMRSLFSPGSALKPGRLDDVVMDLDSELNGWLESTPAHVKWDIHASSLHDHDEFRNQAAYLRMEHNYLLIIVHRPFITFEKPSAGSLAAHAICTSAARGNARLLEFCLIGPHMLMAAVSSAMVLLIGVWGANKLNIRVDLDAVMKDVRHCQDALRSLAPMFQVAEMISVGLDRLVVSAPPQQSFRHTQKRSSDSGIEHDALPATQYDDEFNYQYAYTPEGQRAPIYEGDGGALMFHPPDQLVAIPGTTSPVHPYLHGSGTISEHEQLWDQSLFALFDQMGPQYTLLHHHPHTAGNMNYGPGSWVENEQWPIYGKSHPPDH